VPDVYEGGRAFESVNEPTTNEVGQPPFTMTGHKLHADSEADVLGVLDIDGDGILSARELSEARRGRNDKNPGKAAQHAKLFERDRAEQCKKEFAFELRSLQGGLSEAEWAEKLDDVHGTYLRNMAGETMQDIWNICKSDMLRTQVFMVAERWAKHNDKVWCYRFDGYDKKMGFHGWDVAPTFGNPMVDMFNGWTTKMFEAGVDVDDSGYVAYYEPSRRDMFDSLHEDIRGCWTEFVGAADRLGGEAGDPGWKPFARLGDNHMIFNYPTSEEESTTEGNMTRAMRARREKMKKAKAKFGKFLEGEMSSDEEFKEPEKEVTGIEKMVELIDTQSRKMIDSVAW